MNGPRPWTVVDETHNMDTQPMWTIREEVAAQVFMATARPQVEAVFLRRWFDQEVVPHLPVYDRNPDSESRHP